MVDCSDRGTLSGAVTRLACILLIAPLCACLSPRYAVQRTGDRIVLLNEADGIRAKIAPGEGGELTSLEVLHDGEWVETLYLADDYSPRDGWTGKAPLLWPAVGRTVDGFEVDGQRYAMPGHGFARDHAWRVEGVGDSPYASAVVSMEDSSETREVYPFGFRIELEHMLIDGGYGAVYRVTAKEGNAHPMPFAMGNHITFNTPLLSGSNYREMVFRTPSSDRLLQANMGAPDPPREPRSHGDGIRLDEWEIKEPISLTGYADEPWMELEDPGGLTMRIEHSATLQPREPSIAFNVWGDPPNGYFSPEPWVGVQNALNLPHGRIELEPGESFTWSISVYALEK